MQFSRTRMLLGSEALEHLFNTKVILFGVGGVGSWCAEALVRTGVGHLTIVDGDSVCASNINRQLMATNSTIGRPKVEVLRERLLDINPSLDIQAIHGVYTAETADTFHICDYDYVIDAIDSLKDKAHLILTATNSPATLFSAMGAALKLNPTRISVAEFWKVKGCPLAATLRRRFRSAETFPAKKFQCVYSEELLHNCEEDASEPTRANGSLVHITGISGFTLAGLLIQDVVNAK